MDEERKPAEREETEPDAIRPTPDAVDPSGAHANTPGRTGRPPAVGTEHAADETVPPPS
jgi:hypothetical protein